MQNINANNEIDIPKEIERLTGEIEDSPVYYSKVRDFVLKVGGEDAIRKLKGGIAGPNISPLIKAIMRRTLFAPMVRFLMTNVAVNKTVITPMNAIEKMVEVGYVCKITETKLVEKEQIVELEFKKNEEIIEVIATNGMVDTSTLKDVVGLEVRETLSDPIALRALNFVGMLLTRKKNEWNVVGANNGVLNLERYFGDMAFLKTLVMSLEEVPNWPESCDGPSVVNHLMINLPLLPSTQRAIEILANAKYTTQMVPISGARAFMFDLFSVLKSTPGFKNSRMFYNAATKRVNYMLPAVALVIPKETTKKVPIRKDSYTVEAAIKYLEATKTMRGANEKDKSYYARSFYTGVHVGSSIANMLYFSNEYISQIHGFIENFGLDKLKAIHVIQHEKKTQKLTELCAFFAGRGYKFKLTVSGVTLPPQLKKIYSYVESSFYASSADLLVVIGSPEWDISDVISKSTREKGGKVDITELCAFVEELQKNKSPTLVLLNVHEYFFGIGMYGVAARIHNLKQPFWLNYKFANYRVKDDLLNFYEAASNVNFARTMCAFTGVGMLQLHASLSKRPFVALNLMMLTGIEMVTMRQKKIQDIEVLCALEGFTGEDESDDDEGEEQQDAGQGEDEPEQIDLGGGHEPDVIIPVINLADGF